MDDAGAGVAAGSDSGVATDYGYGLEIPLSERELSFLKEAGIAVHMLNNMDRAAVIRALSFDNSLIEDMRAGNAGSASLVYAMGNLRNELSHTQQEISEEEAGKADIDISELDDEERAMLKTGSSKKAVLDHMRQRKAEEAAMKKETASFLALGGDQYAQASPIPALALAEIFGGGGDDAIMTTKQGKANESAQSPQKALPAGLGDLAFVSSLKNLGIAVSDMKDNDPSHLSAQRTGKGQKVVHEAMPLGGYDPAKKS